MSKYAVDGFTFSATKAGIKASGAPDLALAVMQSGVSAGVFTQNIARAACVDIARAHVDQSARAVVVSSGNANACTGKRGAKDALDLAKLTAKPLGLRTEDVAIAQTGVIGVPMPMTKVRSAVPALIDGLRDDGALDFAEAIMTTDQSRKVITLKSGRARFVGIAKGAGMIHPNMATTLAFVFTDANVTKRALQSGLKRSANKTFNQISVDAETSTNDSLFALASQQGPKLNKTELEAGLTKALEALAMMIVSDGEGALHVAEIVVTGTKSNKDAQRVADRIARSMLVKTAMHGRDPNWGRILSAAGCAGVAFDLEDVTIKIGRRTLFRRGAPARFDQAAVAKTMSEPRYKVQVSLGAGSGEGRRVTCDLGHNYIRMNAEYTT